MGYILPITPHTYHAYQKRMEEEKASPHHIDQVYRIAFPKLNAEFDHLKHPDAPYNDQLHEEGNRATLQSEFYQLENQQKATLTGKGGSVNAQA